MFTTRQVLALLSSANPSVLLTEDRIRHAVRRHALDAPDTFGGRWAWRWRDVVALAAVLELKVPDGYVGTSIAAAGTAGGRP
jgi:hypothetical protein